MKFGEYRGPTWPWVRLGVRWDGETLTRVEETVWPKPSVYVTDDVFFVVVDDDTATGGDAAS